jgi:hypothetical protein
LFIANLENPSKFFVETDREDRGGGKPARKSGGGKPMRETGRTEASRRERPRGLRETDSDRADCGGGKPVRKTT